MPEARPGTRPELFLLHPQINPWVYCTFGLSRRLSLGLPVLPFQSGWRLSKAWALSPPWMSRSLPVQLGLCNVLLRPGSSAWVPCCRHSWKCCLGVLGEMLVQIQGLTSVSTGIPLHPQAGQFPKYANAQPCPRGNQLSLYKKEKKACHIIQSNQMTYGLKSMNQDRQPC